MTCCRSPVTPCCSDTVLFCAVTVNAKNDNTESQVKYNINFNDVTTQTPSSKRWEILTKICSDITNDRVSTDKQIKAKYVKLMKLVHPDKCDTEGSLVYGLEGGEAKEFFVHSHSTLSWVPKIVCID